MSGRFIVIEGLDGTGKDTLIDRYSLELNTRGVNHVVLRDPPASIAGGIREMLLTDKVLEDTTRLFLYLAARSELLYKQILPALLNNVSVICNRFALSTYAYQGIHFSESKIAMLHSCGMLEMIKPDLQVVLLSKRSFRDPCEEDVMGEYCNAYRKSIAERYLALSENPEHNIRLIMADGKSVEEVYQEARSHMSAIL